MQETGSEKENDVLSWLTIRIEVTAFSKNENPQ